MHVVFADIEADVACDTFVCKYCVSPFVSLLHFLLLLAGVILDWFTVKRPKLNLSNSKQNLAFPFFESLDGGSFYCKRSI